MHLSELIQYSHPNVIKSLEKSYEHIKTAYENKEDESSLAPKIRMLMARIDDIDLIYPHLEYNKDAKLKINKIFAELDNIYNNL
jgi:hypothetical protein